MKLILAAIAIAALLVPVSDTSATAENQMILLEHTKTLVDRLPQSNVAASLWALHTMLSRKEGQTPQSEINTVEKIFPHTTNRMRDTIQWVIKKLDMPLPDIG